LEALRVGYFRAVRRSFVWLSDYESNARKKKEEKAMKRLIGLLVVLAVAGMWLPAMAVEQTISILQSRDAGNPSPEQWALCNEKAQEVPIPGAVVQISPLNAEWWTVQTRSKDGRVNNEFIHQVGNSDACAFAVWTGSSVRMALYGDNDIAGVKSEGWGECTFAISGLPTPDSQIGNCTMLMEADPSQGIVRMFGSSNSVFGPATGSIWTIRIFWEE
jgi:hypothetical protein